MSKIETQLTIDEIAQIPFLNDLPDNELEILLEMLELFHYEENKFIFKEGETQDSMFFMVEGSVNVLKRTEDGMEEILAKLQAPQVIGEMALVSPGKRSASVKSLTPLVVIRFGCSSFERIIKKKPELAVKIIRKVADTVCTRLKKANNNYVKVIHPKMS